MTNIEQRIDEILDKISRGERISPFQITDSDRANPTVMSLVACHASQEDIFAIIGDTNDPTSERMLLYADPISAIRVILHYPEFGALIAVRELCDLIIPAFKMFLSEDPARRINSEDELKRMFQNLRGFCPRLAEAVLEFAPPGIALQECGD